LSISPSYRRLIGLLFVGLALVSGTWLFLGNPQESHAIHTVANAKSELPLAPEGERWQATTTVLVRTQPTVNADIRAIVPAGEPFIVHETVGGPQCGEPWGVTEGGGYACLDGARKTEEVPFRLPRLVRFVHPDPREWDSYMDTMRYDTTPPDKVDAMVPFIYAKRWGKWTGPNYESAESYGAGEQPLRRLSQGRKYHFIGSEYTERGTVLTRSNGAVVPADSVHIYPLTKFHGWDVRSEPIPKGFLPAWAINYDGTPVHTEPSASAPVGRTLDYHDPILVEDEPVDREGHWWIMPNGLGPGIPGYVNDEDGIRHWVPSPPPDGLSAAESWLDVDLDQQVLALRRGSTIEFTTLVSTGDRGTPTPRGIYRLRDKAAWSDMASRPESDDPYYVEKVPWVMHFKHRYALHGTFWHWGFGHPASHGCINLSVRDARWIYDRVTPVAYGGWHSVNASANDRGTTIRIRRGTNPVRDRRDG